MPNQTPPHLPSSREAAGRQEFSAFRIGLWLPLFLTACAVIAGTVYSRSVAGPFIFGDESTYIQLARNLAAGQGFSGHTQYGPLYPLLISAFFALPDDIMTYSAMRLFNLVCFASISLPVYLLARELTQRTMLHLLAALLVLLMPYGAYVYMIWAEPVFYMTIAWVFYLYFIYSRQPATLGAFLVGVAIGVTFLLKPGAIILAIAAVLVEFGKLSFASKDDRWSLLRSAMGLFLGIGLLTVPWLIRNAFFTDGGALGYPGAATEMKSRIAEIGAAAFYWEVFLSAFYQISYIILGTFGFATALVALTVSRWRHIEPALRLSITFLILTLFGMIALSAVHMTAYRVIGYHFPNGRYFCGYFPIVFLFYFAITFGQERLTRRSVGCSLLAVALSFAVIVLATPLLVVSPSGLVNNPEMGAFFTLFDGGHIVWRGLFAPTLWQRFGVGLFIIASVGLSLLAVRFRAARAIFLVLFASATGFMSSQSHRFIVKMAASQSPMNQVVSYAAARQDSGQIFFDPALAGGAAEFVMQAWTGRQEAHYISVPVASLSHQQTPAAGLTPASSTAAINAYYITPRQLDIPVVFVAGWLNVYKINSPQ